jgi:hypothetical protein
MTPPAQVLSRGMDGALEDRRPAASAGSRAAMPSAVAAPAGPEPTMMISRRSTPPRLSAIKHEGTRGGNNIH